MPETTLSVECDQCGADMKQVDAWTTKSPPLIGKTIEYAEYTCPACGSEALFKRTASDEEWTRK